MKHIKITLLSVSMAFFAASCNMDRLPEDKIATDTFWTTENDATMALNGVYDMLSGSGYENLYYDGFTDNAYAQYRWESTATEASAGNILPTLNFGYSFGIIRRANALLENIDKVPMDKNLATRYKAEARFLRAFNYFDLAQTFGPLPLVVKTGELDENTLTPLPEDSINDFVISELNAIESDLPVSYSAAKDAGRITKGAVQAFKARVYLYTGKFAEAAAAAQVVMNSGTYSLFNSASTDYTTNYDSFLTFATPAERTAFYQGISNYQGLFWSKYKLNNKETILEAQFIEDPKGGYSNYFSKLLSPSQEGGWSSITPTIELVNAYWKRDGTAFSPPSNATRAANYNKGAIKPAYLDEFKNRDTRLYASIMFPQSPWSYYKGFANNIFVWSKGANNTTKTGYNFKKIIDPISMDAGLNASSNFKLIRYAEVLLTYAEAKNEVSGPDASIYDALDKIRTRVGMPVVDRTLTQSTLRDLIRNERRIEFACEGHRFYDMRRWRIGAQVMKNIVDITNASAQTRVWDDKFYRYPYPQNAVDLNPKLKEAQAAKGY